MHRIPYILLMHVGHNGGLFQVIFERAGYPTEFASTNEEALTKMRCEPPLFLQCYVGKYAPTDGLALLQAAREAPELADVPMLVLGWDANEGELQQARELGARKAFSIPVDPDVLVEFARRTASRMAGPG